MLWIQADFILSWVTWDYDKDTLIWGTWNLKGLIICDAGIMNISLDFSCSSFLIQTSWSDSDSCFLLASKFFHGSEIKLFDPDTLSSGKNEPWCFEQGATVIPY